MTSVYGVTFIGAKKQIQEKIEEKVCFFLSSIFVKIAPFINEKSQIDSYVL